MQLEDLISKAQIASLANVDKTTVASWVRRYPDFPQPARQVGQTYLFLRDDVLTWLAGRDDTAVRQLTIQRNSPAWSALLDALLDDRNESITIALRHLGVALTIDDDTTISASS